MCKDCKEPYEADEETLAPYGHVPQGLGKVNFYKGKGCATCNYTGIQGPRGLYEVMAVTAELRDLILPERAGGRDRREGAWRGHDDAPRRTGCRRCSTA